MAYAMIPIFTQTVTSGAPVTITFNNIPTTFTDLKFVISARASNNNAGTGLNFMGVYYNGDPYPAASSFRQLLGNGSSASSPVNSGYGNAGPIADSSQTANTFGNTEIYIPNYTASSFKQIIIDGVTENNATASGLRLDANLYRNSAAITKATFDIGGGGFVVGSTFTLYGIKNA
jgi:hypothetical protein